MISYYIKPKQLSLNKFQLNDNYLVGTSNGFGQFWLGDGFHKLKKMVDTNNTELLDEIEIIDTKKQFHTIQHFLDQVSMLKILNK